MPGDLSSNGQYEHREADFWTCGFFPGSIYALLERAVKFPARLPVPEFYRYHVRDDLLKCGRHWSVALNEMSARTDTHDMGFIVQPALQKDWELTGNLESLQSVKNAACALASRYDPRVGAIRSWDRAINYRYAIEDMEDNFLVIIDSMCNLDLLYYVGHLLGDPNLIDIATTHANTVRTVLLRSDHSTFHLANLDPRRHGEIKAQMTNQGWKDDSTWSRGQAWAIMGFAQTFMWTRDKKFLHTAISCANMFLRELDNARHHHKWVPTWDFHAEHEDPSNPLRDTSAGAIAANGMLLIHQALQSLYDTQSLNELVDNIPGGRDYLTAALLVVEETLDMSLDRSKASLRPHIVSNTAVKGQLSVAIEPSDFDAIVRNATANKNEHAHQPYWDHGSVYADYYLLEFGNKLCRLGLC